MWKAKHDGQKVNALTLYGGGKGKEKLEHGNQILMDKKMDNGNNYYPIYLWWGKRKQKLEHIIQNHMDRKTDNT